MLRHCRANVWVVALYALAMATLGFAHKPAAPVAGALSAIELAAYALPDGTLPDLCLTGHDQDGPQGAAAVHCDACALSHAPGLVPPAQIGLPAQASVRLVAWIDPAGQFSPALHGGPTSRGPPLA